MSLSLLDFDYFCNIAVKENVFMQNGRDLICIAYETCGTQLPGYSARVEVHWSTSKREIVFRLVPSQGEEIITQKHKFSLTILRLRVIQLKQQDGLKAANHLIMLAIIQREERRPLTDFLYVIFRSTSTVMTSLLEKHLILDINCRNVHRRHFC